MICAGEYTLGLLPPPILSDDQPTEATAQIASRSTDKRLGVVALCMMDLKRRGRVGRLMICGTDRGRVEALERFHCERGGCLS
jgi:hypothetical protein